MSDPETKADDPKPPKTVKAVKLALAPAVANDAGLAQFLLAYGAGQIKGELQPDRWSWIYANDKGLVEVVPDRDEKRDASARVCLEGNTVVAWEPL